MADKRGMDPLRRLSESKIKDAIDEGHFENLPGFGKPLQLADDSGVPAELRGAYITLRNAGMLPEEMELEKSRVSLRKLIDAATDGDERARLESDLADLTLRFDVLMQRRRGAGLGRTRYSGRAASRLFGR